MLNSLAGFAVNLKELLFYLLLNRLKYPETVLEIMYFAACSGC